MSAYFGDNAVTELTMEREWHPHAGWTLIRRWRGTPEQIIASIVNFQNAGIPIKIQEEKSPGGYQILTAYYPCLEDQPANQPLADLWDLPVADYERSIWDSPVVVAELNKLYVKAGGVIDVDKLSYLARLRADIEALARGDVVTYGATTGAEAGTPLTVSSLLDTLTSVGVGIEIEVIKELIRALARGQESTLQSGWVLRRRRIVAANSVLAKTAGNANWKANINCVFRSTTDLVTIEAVPTDQLIWDLPEAQWLKKTPGSDLVDGGKWSIEQLYLAANEWSYFYDDAVPPS
jgi:hypothetical protein